MHSSLVDFGRVDDFGKVLFWGNLLQAVKRQNDAFILVDEVQTQQSTSLFSNS